MPWEKTFDVEQALASAAVVFRRHGYRGASMQQLVKAMGVNPGSLYATYGNKQRLFLSALERDIQSLVRELEVYAGTLEPREAIAAAVSKPPGAGALLVRAAPEAGEDPGIAAAVAGGFARVERFFADRIAAARPQGGVAAGPLAASLLALWAGSRLLGEAGPPVPGEKALRHQIEALLEVIG